MAQMTKRCGLDDRRGSMGGFAESRRVDVAHFHNDVKSHQVVTRERCGHSDYAARRS